MSTYDMRIRNWSSDVCPADLSSQSRQPVSAVRLGPAARYGKPRRAELGRIDVARPAGVRHPDHGIGRKGPSPRTEGRAVRRITQSILAMATAGSILAGTAAAAERPSVVQIGRAHV